MCDHCGCREITPIGRLMAEHEKLLDLAGEVRSAVRRGDEAAAREVFAELLDLLWPHVAAEEHGLFAALRASGDFLEHVDGLEAEHRGLRAAVDEAEAADWAGRIPALLDELREHIHAEEYGLFPAALATLGGAEWDAMATAEAREFA